MLFKVQSGKFGENWQDESEWLDSEAWAIKEAKDGDSFSGKYHYRVVDDSGIVLHHFVPPYEEIVIDIKATNPADLLSEIFNNYGIDVDLAQKACLAYVERCKL